MPKMAYYKCVHVSHKPVGFIMFHYTVHLQNNISSPAVGQLQKKPLEFQEEWKEDIQAKTSLATVINIVYGTLHLFSS